MKFEKVLVEEALAFYQLKAQLDLETTYMLFSPHERQFDLEQLTAEIENIQANGLLLAAKTEDGRLVGYIQAEVLPLAKVKHTAEIVVGILADFRGQGIGYQLFGNLEIWAKEQGIHRLALTVMTINKAAFNLYKKVGFEVEGIKRQGILLGEEFIDEYYMAKILT
ncbi:RimJ/RimL family protein N-acetyltransferase [Enterococcus sp. PF1-24]|uniref:GNAT family N-acetyltransferase n=1 Tax=unclassified Enterococcus TaxID=2608891 RepID=UPI002474786C|nr:MULTISPECIES: GNAT family N-acetyltransferase [unclassified Enterococcus]MDH6364143.1 RimJ/RimL family protein N-acetyltransferase [Enterococcus sp. PFB1-1]MDH6401244.1 RimJ/RimL family protein N-acetyltransferase [Enterococcus sp. PF1-24]